MPTFGKPTIPVSYTQLDNNDIDAVDPKLDKLITVGGIIAGIIMFIIIVIIITVVVQSNNVEIPTTRCV